MVKYVPLDAVLNYIPEAVRQQVDTPQIKSWAYLMYRTFELPTSEELQVSLITIRNHRANLPQNVKRIIDVRHQNPGVDIPQTILRDYGDYRMIVAQQVFFSSPLYLEAKPLKYLGQMRAPLIDESLYCGKCEVGFSIDKTMTCLVIDYPDGEAVLVYYAPIEQDGEMWIPDDPNLMMGLSYFIQSRYWEEKMYSHEANAIQLASETLMKAVGHLDAFKGRVLLKGINVNSHNRFVMRRNKFNNWRRN